MAATEQQHEQALKKFLDERPELRIELDNLNPLLAQAKGCLLYTSPSPRDRQKSRMPSSA